MDNISLLIGALFVLGIGYLICGIFYCKNIFNIQSWEVHPKFDPNTLICHNEKDCPKNCLFFNKDIECPYKESKT